MHSSRTLETRLNSLTLRAASIRLSPRAGERFPAPSNPAGAGHTITLCSYRFHVEKYTLTVMQYQWVGYSSHMIIHALKRIHRLRPFVWRDKAAWSGLVKLFQVRHFG